MISTAQDLYTELGMFIDPQGIAVDKNGAIYVCDLYNNRVQIF